MTYVNTELASDNGLTHKQKVTALFGSSPGVILKAVGSFLGRSPGDVDHHNLRLVAAAAPHINDPKLVAELIDGLAITGMQIAMRPIEIEQTRQQFGAALPSYRPRTRQGLVSDLIQKTTLRLLSSSPPSRLTDAARSMVGDHLLELARGPQNKQAEALSSPHVTPAVVDAVLDNIEQRILRAEVGSATREPTRLPLDVVGDGLVRVLDRNTTCTSPAQVERAWRLLHRCDQDRTVLEHALWKVVRSSKLSEDMAMSVLDAVEHFKPANPRESKRELQSRMRGQMMSVPEMPEAAARIAASHDHQSSELYETTDDAIRTDGVRYFQPSASPLVDPRWYVLRHVHYTNVLRGSSEPLRPLSSDDVDRLLVTLPLKEVGAGAIRQMRDAEALRAMAAKAGRLSTACLAALVHNEHTPPDVSFEELWGKKSLRNLLRDREDRRALMRSYPPMSPSKKPVTARDLLLISDPRLDDANIARMLSRIDEPEERCLVLDVVLHSPSAGHQVLAQLIEHAVTIDDMQLRIFAATTRSPEMHRRLLALVDGRVGTAPGDERSSALNEETRSALRNALYVNGSAGLDIVGADANPDGWRSSAEEGLPNLPNAAVLVKTSVTAPFFRTGERYGYGPLDVARQAIADGTRDNSRIDALVNAARRDGVDPLPGTAFDESDLTKAVSLLAEHGLLSPVHWHALTSVPDTHAALRFSMHPSCPPEMSGFESEAAQMLSATSQAIAEGTPLPPDHRLRTWNQLPNNDDVSFEQSSAAELIDGQTVAGLTLRLIKNPKELRKAADYMGNCLQGYEQSVRGGFNIVVLAGEGESQLAVSWITGQGDDGDKVDVDQMNSRFNQGLVPPEFRIGIHELTDRLNNEQLTAVVRDTQTTDTPPVVEASRTVAAAVEASQTRPAVVEVVGTPAVVEGVETVESADTSITSSRPVSVRRPAPRRALGDLAPRRGEAARALESPNGPSLLASTTSGEQVGNAHQAAGRELLDEERSTLADQQATADDGQTQHRDLEI